MQLSMTFMILAHSIIPGLTLITVVDDAVSLHAKGEDKAADDTAPPRHPKLFCPQPHKG